MQEELITLQTAILAKEKGYNIEGQTVFDLKNDNKIINFKDNAIQEFINDVETGYRDKALYYLKDGINVTDDNTDEGYFLLAPTQSLLQKWLRVNHKIDITIMIVGDSGYEYYIHKNRKVITNNTVFPCSPEELKNLYEKTLELVLQEALKLIK